MSADRAPALEGRLVVESLQIRLEGIDPARGAVIARLVAGELMTRGRELAGAHGTNARIERAAPAPLAVDRNDPDAAIAASVARAVVGSIGGPDRGAH